MIYIKKKDKINWTLIIIGLLFCSNIPVCYSKEDLQTNWSLSYKSDFFWIIINDTYYDSHDFELKMYADFIFQNNKENATFELELIETEENEVTLSIEKKYFYNIGKRILYSEHNQIGKIHLFLTGRYEENETVILQQFDNDIITGKVHNKDTPIKVMNEEITCYEVAVREEKGNYTGYFYSKNKNILVSCIINPLSIENVQYEDLLLKNLFKINGFYGIIDLEYTNINLKKADSPTLFESIFPIVLIVIISVLFLLTFLLIRRNLKEIDQRSQKIRRR